MVASSHATVDDRDGVRTITFDRQDKLNAISPSMTEVLWDAVHALRERDDLRVLVIRAVGPYFTAGYDITDIDEQERPPSRYRNDYLEHHRLYDAMEELDKPIILAAQGKCFGAGVEMSGSCDFRFAAADAIFKLPEINLAVIAGSGGTSRMTRLLGQHWAKWLAMAGQPVDAQRALMIGLVHDVYPADEFHDRVHEFAVGLTRLPREALGLAKIAINMCANTDPATARDVERLTNNVLVYGQEYKQRVAAFKEHSARRR
ncbi:MAG: acyl-CoA hydratase [Nocardia sp.]|uniref:enoyl-CoA hydratase/isomerase family protein n=1 Tax=Nocardia sp. TaxID=1821 RepID=UPI002611D630|nr:enoyl-CoA hydratase/isomerase family protein [Nocardia sp.]MCU1646115.1 acyl-CoA hydratase [Nocardia sp.]